MDYNGSTHLINKIEELLAAQKLSTAAAVRMLLESQLHNIRARHDMSAQIEKLRMDTQKEIEVMKSRTQIEIELLKRTSIGWRMYEKPKQAFIIIFIIVSFFVSDIRQPVLAWVMDNIKTLLAAF